MAAAWPRASWIRSLTWWPAFFFFFFPKALTAILIQCWSLEPLGAWGAHFCWSVETVQYQAWEFCLHRIVFFISTVVTETGVVGGVSFMEDGIAEQGKSHYISSLTFYLLQILTEGWQPVYWDYSLVGEDDRCYGDSTQQALGVYCIKLGNNNNKKDSVVCLTEFVIYGETFVWPWGIRKGCYGKFSFSGSGVL